jgi:small subunit ribosomal protein S16
MLVIRLKRYGKTHFATYRLVVQDAAKHPTSGKVVAYVGNYNPHTKTVNLDKEQIEKYLSHGAQPSSRVIKLLTDAKIKLPHWVKIPNLKKTRSSRNPDKLRRNQPEVAEPVEAAPPTEETEKPANQTAESAGEEAAVDKVAEPSQPTAD